MIEKSIGLLPRIAEWLTSEPTIKSAILFGSSARASDSGVAAEPSSDVDLQVIAAAPALLEGLNWNEIFPQEELCIKVIRPATGNVRKMTIVLKRGQIDLVIIPFSRLYLARLGMAIGLHRISNRWDGALNEIRTSIQSGYRFIKGEKEWSRFYSKIIEDMPGVRVSDEGVRHLADVAVCDFLWILQKLDRGELMAAQHALHQSLSQTNFRLLRELRLRRGEVLKTFGLARYLELSLKPGELELVRIDASLKREELTGAAWHAHQSLIVLMAALVPEWKVPHPMVKLLQEINGHLGAPGR
jgi:hypothetical protein